MARWTWNFWTSNCGDLLQRNDGIMVLMVVAMFFAGMALGRILFAHESEPMPSCCR